ncbi:sugar ABC transporter permease [Agrobacterium vitis]|uniref:ABC transporter permease subunit n=1 Tax=Agrobacterium vitis TaxID=373 RepID=A0A1S2DNR7_AGRVI|nr:sugar ABC transporter permease [Agrobacterium vitis]MCE6075695.1 ABC transporter permease subunit [Agrobacterium vitis]MCF1465564.1 sugar ABC transporter permease [Agrobacterium vitis]MUO70363.1 ABC transporter permease subunit [Agrobacterium vitis]MUO82446.1 ABC transporter permease subunit [Agrobacterium vitis]MVA34710.1 ABC transporter permease subunit [Agrobacterium vitis]
MQPISTPSPFRASLARNAPGYLFLLPWFIGFFVLTLGPALFSFWLSLTDYNLLQSPNVVGMDNYIRIATADEKFMSSMRVTLVYVVLSVPLKLTFALLVALLLNKGIRGLPLYRAVFYLPSLLGSSVAIAVVWRQLFDGDGAINVLLWNTFGIEGPSWISNPDYSLYTLVILAVWQFGSPMIIFLAGLRQIPVDMYEAASLDGASKVRMFFKITLPLLTPVIFFNAVVQTIDAFKAFTPAYVISSGTGGPIDSTLFYTLYLYQEAFGYFRMGYAAALAWILVIIIALFTAFSFLSSRYWVHYDD